LRLRPTIAEVCDTVGRQGRALWIHIINASQRAEVGKMAGLMAQQTFSIGLKVKDAASRGWPSTRRGHSMTSRVPAGHRVSGL
jgi:S-DNA-T family DNA segregation ATPase FtsK/SpoIIIE